jgi:hypothetical protein
MQHRLAYRWAWRIAADVLVSSVHHSGTADLLPYAISGLGLEIRGPDPRYGWLISPTLEDRACPRGALGSNWTESAYPECRLTFVTQQARMGSSDIRTPGVLDSCPQFSSVLFRQWGYAKE